MGVGGKKVCDFYRGGEECLRKQHLQFSDIFNLFYPLNHNKVFSTLRGPPPSAGSRDPFIFTKKKEKNLENLTCSKKYINDYF